MRKTRSFVGKTLLATMVLLAISISLTAPASAFISYDIPTTSIYMDPFRISGSSGDTVKIYAWIKDVTSLSPLFSFQIGALFDPSKVSCTTVQEGGFLSNHGADFVLAFPGTIDNVNGKVTPYGWLLTETPKAKTGSGILANFTFTMLTTGYSDIHIAGFIAQTSDAVTEIIANNIDYYTAVHDSTEYFVKIEGNAHGELAYRGGYSGQAFNVVDKVIGPTTYKGEFNFTATGYTANGDSFAYFNATIPKSLMWSTLADDWMVVLNGATQASRLVTENTTHTTVSLTFSYSDSAPVNTVAILSTDAVPEFTGLFFAMLLMLATLAAAMFGKASWSAKRKS